MNISNDEKLDFDDVLIVPHRSKAASRKEVELEREFKFYHSDKVWNGVPIVAANMDTTGSFNMAWSLFEKNCVTCLHKHYNIYEMIHEIEQDEIAKYAWISIGIQDRDLEHLKIIKRQNIDFNVCIDVANGYTDYFVDFCKRAREILGPKSIIMAGNVCTPEMVTELILHGGVDIVKVGIGPGSACTTRLKTGIGYPQLSAIDECAHAAHGLQNGKGRIGLICADGGCRKPCDVVKAFGANADFVMLGGMLAGTDECAGDWEYEEQKVPSGIPYEPPEIIKVKKALKFYGMSSEEAQKKHNGGMSNYKASEGRVKSIPYKGPVDAVLDDIMGGMRSACAYTGAVCLKDFAKTTKFIRVNRTHYDQSV